jgi:hypothetical protein
MRVIISARRRARVAISSARRRTSTTSVPDVKTIAQPSASSCGMRSTISSWAT